MNYAIILAGGKGVRFQGDIPKQFVELTNCPMLVYSMRTAQVNKHVDAICVVAPESYHVRIRKWAKEYGITKLSICAESGRERYQSVYQGLMALPAKPRDTVIIMTAVVLGDRYCIKVTYPEDLAMAQALYPLFVKQEQGIKNVRSKGV